MLDEGRGRVPITLALALVILLGVFFRVGAVEEKLIWHDEVYTRIFAAGYSSSDWGEEIYSGQPLPVGKVQVLQRHNPDRGVMDTVRGLAHDEPQHPPLYYVLARSWVNLFGDAIGSIRLLSGVLSLLGLPAIFWLCRELFDSRRVAWTSVALYSASPFFVLYAQEAREYALWGTLLLLSTAALLWATRLTETPEATGREKGRAWLLYALLVAGGLYTSFSTASVILVHILWICLRERLRFTPVSLRAAGALAISALLFLPWARMLWTHFESFQASMAWASEIVIPTSELLRTLALNMSRPLLDLWPDLLDWPAALGVALTLLVVFAALLGLRRATGDARLLVVLLVVLPIALLLGPDLVFGGIRSISSRYLTPSLLGILVATAFLLGRGDSLRHKVGTGLVLGASLLSCGLNHGQVAPWTKGVSCRLPEVAEVVNREEAPVVVGNREQHHPGNLLALSNLLRPESQMVFLAIGEEDRYELPEGESAVFLYSPTPPFREKLQERASVRVEPVIEGLYLQLWRVLPR